MAKRITEFCYSRRERFVNEPAVIVEDEIFEEAIKIQRSKDDASEIKLGGDREVNSGAKALRFHGILRRIANHEKEESRRICNVVTSISKNQKMLCDLRCQEIRKKRMVTIPCRRHQCWRKYTSVVCCEFWLQRLAGGDVIHIRTDGFKG